MLEGEPDPKGDEHDAPEAAWAYHPRMSRRFIGIRWWLGVAFALVAAVSTALVVSQFSTQSQNAFRDRAQALALGSAVLAAQDITVAARTGRLQQTLPVIARRENLELHIFNARGRPCLNLPNGMRAIHTSSEAIAVADVEGIVRIVLALVDAARVR